MSEVQPNWLLCGGIGSGKSAFRKILESHGLHTIDSDSVGHEVLVAGGPAAAEVAATWPEVVVDGTIDRKKLGAIVFADSAELERLERITHPHIFSTIEERLEGMSPPVIVEIPLLRQPFSGHWRRIVVDTPDEMRVERGMTRGMTRAEVLRRMRNQPSRQQWLGAADLVIPNSGDLPDLAAATESALPVIRGVAAT